MLYCDHLNQTVGELQLLKTHWFSFTALRGVYTMLGPCYLGFGCETSLNWDPGEDSTTLSCAAGSACLCCSVTSPPLKMDGSSKYQCKMTLGEVYCYCCTGFERLTDVLMNIFARLWFPQAVIKSSGRSVVREGPACADFYRGRSIEHETMPHVTIISREVLLISRYRKSILENA